MTAVFRGWETSWQDLKILEMWLESAVGGQNSPTGSPGAARKNEVRGTRSGGGSKQQWKFLAHITLARGTQLYSRSQGGLFFWAILGPFLAMPAQTGIGVGPEIGTRPDTGTGLLLNKDEVGTKVPLAIQQHTHPCVAKRRVTVHCRCLAVLGWAWLP